MWFNVIIRKLKKVVLSTVTGSSFTVYWPSTENVAVG